VDHRGYFVEGGGAGAHDEVDERRIVAVLLLSLSPIVWPGFCFISRVLDVLSNSTCSPTSSLPYRASPAGTGLGQSRTLPPGTLYHYLLTTSSPVSTHEY
jgi:hypothetical protein